MSETNNRNTGGFNKPSVSTDIFPDGCEPDQLETELFKMQEKHNRELMVLNNKIISYEKELEFYSVHYPAAVNGRDAYAHEYNLLTSSIYWRITKPLRVFMSITKSLLFYLSAVKGLKKLLTSIVSVGFTETSRRIRNHFEHNRNNDRVNARSLLTANEKTIQRQTVFERDILISILVPLYNTPEKYLREMIESVMSQTYINWELCLADGSDDPRSTVRNICQSYAEEDNRIKYKKLETNGGISENTNRCIELSAGEYLGLLDHDDILHPSALYEVMKVLAEKDADFIYTDENTFDETISDAHTPNFKPDFSPDTLRAYNYICHFSVFRRELLNRAGLFRSEFDGSQDYDMVLRLTEQAKTVVHIPKILYFWRAHTGSVASHVTKKPYTLDTAKKALAEHLDRVGLRGTVEDGHAPSIYKITYEIAGEPLISIIIPNKDHVLTLKNCLNSIFEISTYKNFEIIIIENNSEEKATFDYYDSLKSDSRIRVIRWDGEFNYSAINNFGAKFARGDYLLLLNNDITVITPDWLQEMLMYAQRKDVGVVGAKLYYPDDTIQHAGTIIGLGGVAGHTHVGFSRTHPGYMRRLTVVQNLSAVTAACLMLSKKVFDEVGGLDVDFKVAFNDVDLCMRIRGKGYLVVFTPYAELYHYESKSRGYEDTPQKQARFTSEINLFRSRWKEELRRGDPYYNPNLTLDRTDFSAR